MKVDAAMTRDVICVESQDSLLDAQEIMKEWEIRHLPVTSDGCLVGILSDRDILVNAAKTDAGELVLPSMTVAEAMTRNPITCDVDADLASIGQTMLDEKIDSVPVVDGDGDLVGLITSSDLIQILVDRERMVLGRPIPFAFKLHRSVRRTGAGTHA